MQCHLMTQCCLTKHLWKTKDWFKKFIFGSWILKQRLHFPERLIQTYLWLMWRLAIKLVLLLCFSESTKKTYNQSSLFALPRFTEREGRWQLKQYFVVFINQFLNRYLANGIPISLKLSHFDSNCTKLYDSCMTEQEKKR